MITLSRSRAQRERLTRLRLAAGVGELSGMLFLCGSLSRNGFAVETKLLIGKRQILFIYNFCIFCFFYIDRLLHICEYKYNVSYIIYFM